MAQIPDGYSSGLRVSFIYGCAVHRQLINKIFIFAACTPDAVDNRLRFYTIGEESGRKAFVNGRMIMEDYRIIDLTNYPRREHLAHFLSYTQPHLSVTVEVDVTDLVSFVKHEGCSFYMSFLHVAALAADAVPELRRRIHWLTPEEMLQPEHAAAAEEGPFKGLEIREYPGGLTSHTESAPGGLFCFCTLDHRMPWPEYIREAEKKQQLARESGSLKEDAVVESLLFATCLPWFKYTQITQAVDKNSTNPQLSWGKYGEDYRGRLMMPLTIGVHHGLCDGRHLGQFYENVDKVMKDLVEHRLG